MKYPEPKEKGYFFFCKEEKDKKKKEEKKIKQEKEFSWANGPSEQMKEYLAHIETKKRLFMSLPFIDNIYLCNSITFNALHDNSDIDITCIAQEGRLRTARFYSLLFFSLTGSKRTSNKQRKRFCLSFYLTKDHCNLYSLSLTGIDIYLLYRIMHLVPLYSKKEEEKDLLIKANSHRTQSYFPNHPQKTVIQIGQETYTGQTKTKTILEKIHSWSLWDIIEKTIKYTRHPILSYKRKRLGKKGKEAIRNDTTLKFHDCVRKRVQMLFELSQKTKR